jgi:hypothetical protein
MQPQRTTPPPSTTTPTPPVAVLTVNGLPTRDYLATPDPDREPPRWLVGERAGGGRVVWTPNRRRTSCAHHPTPGGCPCRAALAALADPATLHAWHRRLGWRGRRRLHLAALELTGRPRRPGWEPPCWTWGLSRRLIWAAAAVALLLLLVVPLLRR